MLRFIMRMICYLTWIANHQYYGGGVGSVNVDYVTFRNSDGSAIYARGGRMESVAISNCCFESTCRNTTTATGCRNKLPDGANGICYHVPSGDNRVFNS